MTEKKRVQLPKELMRLKGFHIATLTYLDFVATEIRGQIVNEDWKSELLGPIERTIEILNEHVLVEGLDGPQGFEMQ